jgi:hypothetical protein
MTLFPGDGSRTNDTAPCVIMGRCEVAVPEIRRLTPVQVASFSFSVAELRQFAREHGVFIPRDALHHEAVRALTAAGVGLPPKPLDHRWP